MLVAVDVTGLFPLEWQGSSKSISKAANASHKEVCRNCSCSCAFESHWVWMAVANAFGRARSLESRGADLRMLGLSVGSARTGVGNPIMRSLAEKGRKAVWGL